MQKRGIQRISAVELLLRPPRIVQVVVSEPAIESGSSVILPARQAVEELPVSTHIQVGIEGEVFGDVGVQLERQLPLCHRLVKRAAIPIGLAQIPVRERIGWVVPKGFLEQRYCLLRFIVLEKM